MKPLFPHLLSLILILSLTSCDKTDDMTVYLKTSGRLTTKLVDNNGTAINNTNVKLYEFYNSDYSSSSILLDEMKTDSKGIVDFGDLNAHSYTLVVDTPKVSGIKYLPVKTVQVVSATNKDVVINVQDYVGTLNLNFKMDNSALSGLNLLIIPYESYSYYESLSYLKNKAEFSGVTDYKGDISFALPSGRHFRIIAYMNDKYTTIDSWILKKGEVRNRNHTLSYYDFYYN